MLRPTFLNITVFIFVKYLLIYLIFMVATNNYKLLQIGNIKNGQDLFYYLWLVLFIPIVDFIIFSVPYFLSFKSKSRSLFICSVLLITVCEYFVYVYFTSQKILDIKGLWISVISLIIYFILFYKKVYKYGENL